ncbi:hypothetical protein HU200_053492 [Digitaria exilis]|uniref:Phytocyanin domain-containing protein n=1 Tax=Digitaria exilis TaxID=1010633 RepID=A0A835AMH0_9POAL|nr:hypothetical protein HU200_053492 [Digitaria exilis]
MGDMVIASVHVGLPMSSDDIASRSPPPQQYGEPWRPPYLPPAEAPIIPSLVFVQILCSEEEDNWNNHARRLAPSPSAPLGPPPYTAWPDRDRSATRSPPVELRHWLVVDAPNNLPPLVRALIRATRMKPNVATTLVHCEDLNQRSFSLANPPVSSVRLSLPHPHAAALAGDRHFAPNNHTQMISSTVPPFQKDSRAQEEQTPPTGTYSSVARERSMARLRRHVAAAVMAAAAVLVAIAPKAMAADAAPVDAPAYRNITVGGADGWFFDAKTNSTSGNYSVWANGETFYLGDFLSMSSLPRFTILPLLLCQLDTLLFPTTNVTTYNLCDPSDDLAPTTSIYGGGGGGGGGVEENNTVAIPLVTEGTNYFFSDADGGAQCQKGMHFQIKVEHGQGLPPSLKGAPPAPKERVLAPPPAGTAFSGTGGVEPGDGAGDNGGAGRNGAAAAAGKAGGRFLGAAVAVALVVVLAA